MQEKDLCEEYMGKFPVISISLKSVDGLSFEDACTALKSIIGKDAFVKIERVHEIPVLASGKFKKTICHYKPEEL